jgi:hypothetical protein
VLQSRAELDGKPPVGDEDQTYHVKIGTPAGAYFTPYRTKGRHHDHVPGKRKGATDACKYILQRSSAHRKAALSAGFSSAQCSK